MYNKIVKVILLMFMCGILVACRNKETGKSEFEKQMPEVFGLELHNIECTVYEEIGEKVIDLIIMSKIDISRNSSIVLEYMGGSLECTYTITKGEYCIDDYSEYIINLSLKNIIFTEEKIVVNKIKINYDDKKWLELEPQRFIINCLEGDYSNEDLIFYGSPVLIPYEMKEFPFELGSKREINIKETYISNDLVKYENMNDNNRTINSNIVNITMRFSTPDNKISEYTQYITSIIFVYEIDGKEFVRMTPNQYVVYNPLLSYEDNIRMYYEEVVKER